jgi:glycosyltransferase involved in cell wall biosynthesis
MRRVGIVYRSGQPRATAWSGMPVGLMQGLRDFGLVADLVDAEPARGVERIAEAWATVVRRSRRGGMLAPEVRELRRSTARRRASHLSEWDAAVQLGSDFGIPYPRRFVTYEDLTVRQLLRLSPEEAAALGNRGVSRWLTAQARCYALAVGCCAASRWAAESIVLDYGIDTAKVHVVGIGRNLEPRPVPRDWTQPRFLFVGYDWERKNGPMLLRAFARVRERMPSARLDVVGGHPPVGVVDGVVAHGPLDFAEPRDRARVEALFETATCFVMPSRIEPFGMAYVEAAVAGVPSIGTALGGARDLIGSDGGLLVDPSDEAALVEAMTALCDPERAFRMGAVALERSRFFTWAIVAERIARVLGFQGAEERGS